MKSKFDLWRVASLLMLVALAALAASAQTDTNAPSTATESKVGNYLATGSIEFGYRFTEVRGAQYPCAPGTEDRSSAGLCQDEGMYNTFVNLHTGPRLLEQTLSLRSPGHTGVLFDNLSLSSFGWGGDPNNVARLRLSKSKAYNLSATFRRDQNFFNYNLLANPLNITSGTVTQTGNTLLGFGGSTNGFLVTQSPHFFTTTRRMSDVDLTVAPLSVISVRLGYSRVRYEGPYGWSFHMPRGTDIQPTAESNNTTNLYRAGLDFRFLPKTTISYDQFFTHNSIGISGQDKNLYFGVNGVPGVPVDFGLSWNVAASQPCAASALFRPTCNLGAFYFLTHDFRSTIPTEQISFQSHPTKHIDLSGRAMYTHSHMDGFYSHFWNGKTSTGRQQLMTSSMHNKRDEGSADFGITIHLTDRIRLLDTFRWFNWRITTDGFLNGLTWNPGNVSFAVPLGTPVPATLTGFTTPAPGATLRFIKEERKENEASVEFDFTRAVGARIGYRYTDRFILDVDEAFGLIGPEETSPVSGDIETGQDRASVTGHTGLVGLWFRPNPQFRASFDGELTHNKQETGGGLTDIPPGTTFGLGPLTRITPRHEQQYRVRANYTPRTWAVLSGSMNINQQSNKLFADGYDFHNYNGGFGLMINPNDKLTFDVSYNYNSFMQNTFICPIGTGFGVPFGGSVLSTVCPYDNTGLYQTLGRYDSVNHFVSTLVHLRPVKRFGVALGYSISNSDASQLYTNPLLVPGSLKSSFHRPLAEVELGLAKNLFAKAGWNYYGYNEKGVAPNILAPGFEWGPTLPRDFHANTGTVSLRYAF